MKKILVIDDHRLFLNGMRFLLAQLSEAVTVVECSRVQDAIDRFDAGERFILAMTDIALPGMDGFAFLQAMKERRINCPVAIVSASTNSDDIRRALREGALGFIPKYVPGEVMLDGVRKMLEGDVFLPDELWSQINTRVVNDGQADNEAASTKESDLGDRQLEVLALMARGLTNKQIATILAIGEATVKYHIGILFRALDVKNRTACIREAQVRKLIPLEFSAI